MEAKDTVIKLKAVPKQIFEGKADTIDTKMAYLAGWQDGTKAQAEITWNIAFKAGIQEVVKWLNESDWGRRKGYSWQAKLKDLGIE